MALIKKGMENKVAPRNLNELQHELVQVFHELRQQTIKPSEAKEISNVAGKIVKICEVQINYAALLGIKPQLEFMLSISEGKS